MLNQIKLDWLNCNGVSSWKALTFAALAMAIIFTLVSSFSNFQKDSERLVIESISGALQEGIYFAGGYMSFRYDPQNRKWLPVLLTLEKEGLMSRDLMEKRPYFSASGLQYKVLASMAFPFRKWPGLYLTIAKFWMASLFTLVLIGFVVAVQRDFGALAGWATYSQLLCAYPLQLFSGNLYWAIFLSFFPLSLTMVFYPYLSANKRRLCTFYIIIAIAVLLKSLCSYEYITNIILAPLLPIIYFEWKAQADGKKVIRKTVIRCFLAFFAGCVGFACAFCLNFYQASTWLGSWQAGWKAITASVVYSTIGDSTGNPISITKDLMFYVRYTLLEGQLWIFLSIFWGFLFLSFLKKRAPNGQRLNLGSCLVFLLFSLAASLSWNTLAWGHMRYHSHINFITLYLPFNVVAFAFNGYILSQLFSLTIKNGFLQQEKMSGRTTKP